MPAWPQEEVFEASPWANVSTDILSMSHESGLELIFIVHAVAGTWQALRDNIDLTGYNNNIHNLDITPILQMKKGSSGMAQD